MCGQLFDIELAKKTGNSKLIHGATCSWHFSATCFPCQFEKSVLFSPRVTRYTNRLWHSAARCFGISSVPLVSPELSYMYDKKFGAVRGLLSICMAKTCQAYITSARFRVSLSVPQANLHKIPEQPRKNATDSGIQLPQLDFDIFGSLVL